MASLECDLRHFIINYCLRINVARIRTKAPLLSVIIAVHSLCIITSFMYICTRVLGTLSTVNDSSLTFIKCTLSPNDFNVQNLQNYVMTVSHS